MRCIGNKLAPEVLRAFQTAGQLVELTGNFPDFVPAVHFNTVAVVACTYFADGGGKLFHAPADYRGENKSDGQSEEKKDQGHDTDIMLHGDQKGALIRIVFVEIDGADYGVGAVQRNAGTGFKSLPNIPAVKAVLPR